MSTRKVKQEPAKTWDDALDEEVEIIEETPVPTLPTQPLTTPAPARVLCGVCGTWVFGPLDAHHGSAHR